MPAFYQFPDSAEKGGLRLWPASGGNLLAIAASVARRLRFEHPRYIHSQQRDEFEFVINLKTAKAIGRVPRKR